MPSLWFKQQYVLPILAGDKVDTIRRGECPIPEGTRVKFQVGPRPPFAEAEIICSEVIRYQDVEPERQRILREIYPTGDVFTQILFELIPV